jgi:hypothetical protein
MALQPPPGTSGQQAQTPPTEPDPQRQAPATGAQPQQDDPFAGIQTEGRTWQEIDAEYRARLGGHQRGWTAAERALRDELETAKRQAAAALSRDTSGQQVPDATAQQIAELRRQAEEAEARAVAQERRAKYPELAAVITEAKFFAAADDPDLAKLNAMLAENVGGGTYIAPTAPRRVAAPPAAPKPIAEKTKDELLADLRRVAPQVAEEERRRIGQ